MWRSTPRDATAGYESRVPLGEDECWRTDAAVRALDPVLAELVVAYYMHGGLYTMDRLRLSRSGMYAKLDTAYRLLAQALAKRADTSEGPAFLQRGIG